MDDRSASEGRSRSSISRRHEQSHHGPDRKHMDDEVADHRRKRQRRGDNDRGREKRDRDERRTPGRSHRRASSVASSSSSSSGSSPSSSRSPSPSDSSPRSQARDSSKPATHPKLLRYGAAPITPLDYYLRSTEFRHWLAQKNGQGRPPSRSSSSSRHKSSRRGPGLLEDLSSRQAHRIFDEKFVPRWNEARLGAEYYTGKLTTQSLPTTSHKWSFVGQRTAKEQEEVILMRDGIDSLTNGTSRGVQEARSADRRGPARRREEQEDHRASKVTGSASNTGAADSGWGRRGAGDNDIGPSAPPSKPSHHSDARLEAEEAGEIAQRQERGSRRTARRELQERQDEQAELLLGRPSRGGGGREAQIEKRREQNRSNREFEEARRGGGGDDEISEDILLGGGSFREAIQQRDRRQDQQSAKREDAREARRAEREQEMANKREEYRSKEDRTMQMLKDLAKSRFG